MSSPSKNQSNASSEKDNPPIQNDLSNMPETNPLLKSSSEDPKKDSLPKKDDDSSLSKDESQQETQAELSEVETGNTNQPDFDEIINFDHFFHNYRVAKASPNKESLDSASFSLLKTNIFIYSGDVIDFKTMTKNLSNTEAIKSIRQKINSYRNEEIQKKKDFIENMPFYIRTIGFKETVEYIIPIISDLSREKELITSRFFEIFKKIVDEILKFGDKAYFILKDYLVKVISEFLVPNNPSMENIYHKNQNMIKSISDGLVYLSKHIKNEDKGESVLAIVIKMAQDDDNELKRVASMSLFGALTPYVDKDFVNLFIIPQVKSFADDPSGNVRKEVANQLCNIANNVSKEIFKRQILPVYQKLSKDTLWFVKKVAVEILPKLTKICDSDIVLKNIIPIFKNLANEEKIEVKISLVETLGEFIALLDKKESNNFTELLDFYIKTVQKFSEKSKKEYKTVLQKCSFNFPAMLDFFGKETWPQLKPCFITMANDKEEKVKLPLAAAIGDIANIIGGDLTEEDLIEYVDKFFKNSAQNSDIKIKILQNLPKIIKIMPSSNKKNAYLEFIKFMIVNKDTKWRRRMEFAKIIGKFNDCFPENIIYRRVFPIAINFCFDDISQVRFCSSKHNSKIILQLLSGKDEYKNKTLTIIKSFAQSINYKYRQLFINMCTHLFENEKIFNECIAQLLIDLAYDKVPNVKIILARLIYKLLTKEKYKNLKNNDTIKKIVKILKNDKNKEVVDYINKIKNFNFDELNNIEIDLEKNVNYKFKDNMNFVSKEFGITKNVPLNNIFKESKFGNGDTNEIKDKVEEKKEEHKDKGEEKKESEEQKSKDIEDTSKKEENNKEEKKEEENKKEDNKNVQKEEEHKEDNNKEEKKEEEHKDESNDSNTNNKE